MIFSQAYHREEMVLQCSMKVAPPRGLIALRTKAEIRANLETTTVYVVEIPTKAAYGILKCVKIGKRSSCS